MNKDFPRMLTLLRKERKLSQKEAASQLGISQALLSHYENGVRECGLDFVVKAAELYQVSCDYLLGRSADRTSDMSQAPKDAPSKRQSAAQNANRRLIGNTMHVTFDLAAVAKNRRLDHTVSNYLMLALYRLFRSLYSANGSNPQELFSVPKSIYAGYTDAAMLRCLADIEAMTQPDSGSFLSALSETEISESTLAQLYPEQVNELFHVLRRAENAISKLA